MTTSNGTRYGGRVLMASSKLKYAVGSRSSQPKISKVLRAMNSTGVAVRPDLEASK